jgi:hypothetical protein
MREERAQTLAKPRLARVPSSLVNADSRPPVAIRITRPYASEDEYLERELDTLSRTSITLLGAQPRPDGVVLRFELVLAAGHVLLRGEGRVVGFKPNAHEGIGGLTLRFTRLDMRSKALIDRAASMREKRRPSTQTSPSERPSIPPRPPSWSRRPPPAPRETLPLPPPRFEAVSSSALESAPSLPLLEEAPSSPSFESLPAPPHSPLPPRESIPPSPRRETMAPSPPRESMTPSPPRESRPPWGAFNDSRRSPLPTPMSLVTPKSFPPASGPTRRAAEPPDRDALLGRLRARAKGLDPKVVANHFGDRPRRG